MAQRERLEEPSNVRTFVPDSLAIPCLPKTRAVKTEHAERPVHGGTSETCSQREQSWLMSHLYRLMMPARLEARKRALAGHEQVFALTHKAVVSLNPSR